MDEHYCPTLLELITDLATFGLLVLMVTVVYVIAKGVYDKIDAWLWARRRAKWNRQP